MSRINDMSVSSRFVDLQDIEKNGGATFKLQDKSVTENGVVIADPTYDGLSKVDVDVQGGGGSDLENNKEATIDASTYTDPVEVLPSEGKDGMKKATITVNNIPEIEANKAQTIDVSTYTEPVEVTPTQGKDGMAKATVTLNNIPSGGGAPSMSSPMCLCFVDEEIGGHYIGVLANGTIAQSTSDIPNIKWFVNVEGSGSSRASYTSSQDDLADVFNDYSQFINLYTTRGCTITINGTTVSITNEYETLTLTLSDNIPLMLFVGINPTS